MSAEDIEAAAELALPHRVRRQPLQEIGADVARLRRAAGGRVIEIRRLTKRYGTNEALRGGRPGRGRRRAVRLPRPQRRRQDPPPSGSWPA